MKRATVPWGVGMILAAWCAVGLSDHVGHNGAWYRWLSGWALTSPETLSGHGSSLGSLSGLLHAFSAQFFHVDGVHLLGNAAYFLVFGTQLERIVGGTTLVLSTLLMGTVAMAVTTLNWAHSDAVLIGASGAVSGVLGLLLVLKPADKMGFWLPLGLVPQFVVVPTGVIIASWLMVQLIFVGHAPTVATTTAMVHLVGFMTGVALGSVGRWMMGSGKRRRSQKA